MLRKNFFFLFGLSPKDSTDMKGEENFVEFRVKILFFSRDEIFFYGTRDRQVDTFLTNKSDTKSGLD